MSEDQRARRPVQPFPRISRNIPVALVFFALCVTAAVVVVSEVRTPPAPAPACSPQTSQQAETAATEFERVHVQPSAGTSPYVRYEVVPEDDGFVLVISTDRAAPADAPGCVARTPVRYEETSGS